MKKIAIRFTVNEHDDVKSIAQHLQRFVVEDDYRVSTIAKKIINDKCIVLDIGMEENMPKFIKFVKELDEEEVEYRLYKFVNEDWDVWDIYDLEEDRIPEWIGSIIGLNVIWYGIMTFLQFFFIYDWYSEKYEWSGILSSISAFVTAVVPIFGSLVAYWSVTELLDWERYNALWAFFVYYIPLFGLILYFVWIVIKAFYSDKWHSEFN